MMRNYELVLIFDPAQKAEETKKVLAKIRGLINKKGKVSAEKNWGVKKLSYPLKVVERGKKLLEGEYFQIDFEAESVLVGEMSQKLKLEEKVVRYLFVGKTKKKGGEKTGGKKSK